MHSTPNIPMLQYSNPLGLLKQEELDYYLVKLELDRRDFMENGKEVLAKVVPLRTQLVSQGHTRHLLAETDLMTLRIHCYSPGIGENALHSHTKEDHIFVVLEGTAQFNTGRDGKTVVKASKHQAVVLPAGCYYQFCNSGDTPLVMARIGAGPDKSDMRLNPNGTPIPGRTTSKEPRSRF